MAGNLALYVNVVDFSFARSLQNASPLEQPLRLVQTGTYLIDVYFVSPTGDPADPWTFVDPVGFTNIAIELANPLHTTLTALAFANTWTYVGGATPYVEIQLDLFTEEMTDLLGSSRSAQCTFEIAWQDGAIIEPVQTECLVYKGIIGNTSGIPSPITYPPYVFVTLSQLYALTVQNRFGIFNLTGGTSTDLDGIPTANGQASAGWIVRINNAQGEWVLVAGTHSSDPSGGFVLPYDYDSLLNPLYWQEIG